MNDNRILQLVNDQVSRCATHVLHTLFYLFEHTNTAVLNLCAEGQHMQDFVERRAMSV